MKVSEEFVHAYTALLHAEAAIFSHEMTDDDLFVALLVFSLVLLLYIYQPDLAGVWIP